MKYRTIVADPPWDHSDGTGVHVDSGQVTSLPYATMTLDEIKALPVKSISDNVDADTNLYLWTTSRYLPDAFEVVRAWGFHYVATLVWCKQSRGFSVGGRFQNNVEFILFCVRPKVVNKPEVVKVTTFLAEAAKRAGITPKEVDERMGTRRMAQVWWLTTTEHRCACPTPDQWTRLKQIIGFGDEMDATVQAINAAKGQTFNHTPQGSTTRWFTWPRGPHSQKPDHFYDLVEQISSPPYVELFARRHRLGWDVWGNESANTAAMPLEAS